ncbi:MAG: hypothetical protein R3E76_13585 [Planctomycetota bacterium]
MAGPIISGPLRRDDDEERENHLFLSGLSLPAAIQKLREANPDRRLTAEAENLTEAKLAIDAEADVVLLDDFSLEDIRSAGLSGHG